MSAAAPAQATDAAAGAAMGAADSLLSMLGSLIVVLLLIFALAWLARWLQGARVARGLAMQLQAGVQVGPKERVVLLEIGGQQFLIGVAAGGVSLLHRFEEPVSVSANAMATAQSPFADKLRQLLAARSRPPEA